MDACRTPLCNAFWLRNSGVASKQFLCAIYHVNRKKDRATVYPHSNVKHRVRIYLCFNLFNWSEIGYRHKNARIRVLLAWCLVAECAQQPEIAWCSRGESDLFDNNAEHSEAIKLAEVNLKWQILFFLELISFIGSETMWKCEVEWMGERVRTTEIDWTNENLLGFFFLSSPYVYGSYFSAFGYLLKVPITYSLIYAHCSPRR